MPCKLLKEQVIVYLWHQLLATYNSTENASDIWPNTKLDEVMDAQHSLQPESIFLELKSNTLLHVKQSLYEEFLAMALSVFNSKIQAWISCSSQGCHINQSTLWILHKQRGTNTWRLFRQIGKTWSTTCYNIFLSFFCMKWFILKCSTQ